MARIRSVHPNLPTEEEFMAMSIAAKAAWPLLQMECDDRGIFEWKPVVLKARLLPADNVDFAALLAEWEKLGVIRQYEVGGKRFGAVKDFCRYQRPKKPMYRLPVPDELHCFIGWQGASTEPVPHRSGTGEKPVSDRYPPESESERESESESKSNPAAGAADAAAASGRGLRERLFDTGLAQLIAITGRGEDAARSLMGKFLKNSGDDAGEVLAAIDEAARNKVAHPASWITTRLKKIADGQRELRVFAAVGGGPKAAGLQADGKYYAVADSEQLKAWDAHWRRTKRKAMPRDRNGGWLVESEWPPGEEGRRVA